MRKKIIAGNWKMNKTLSEAKELISSLLNKVNTNGQVEVMIAPSFVNLPMAVEMTKNSDILVSAQNMHFADSGAYTGEISADMLLDIGVETVILGHSERRAYYNETNDSLKKKAQKAFEKGMLNIFCVGEQLSERKSGQHFEVVEHQIKSALFDLPSQAYDKIVIAYEPVWAIGTGETASPEQAQEMHRFIRKVLTDKYGEKLANEIRILYGGSVKPGNAKEIFSQPDVDGGLIGGASLKADDFVAIIEAGKK